MQKSKSILSRLMSLVNRPTTKPANIAEMAAKEIQDQDQVSVETQLSASFSQAIAHLGDREPFIRIGGIYELESIAKSHPNEYHQAAMDVLSSFIRGYRRKSITSGSALRAASMEYENASPDEIHDPAEIPQELQAAVQVVCRRDIAWEQRHLPEYILDLSGAGLHFLQLRNANLYRANLTDANLDKTDLRDANLYQANLTRAYLQFSDLTHANLTKATLQDANLVGTTLVKAVLTDANLTHANLRGANLNEANLDNASLNHANLIEANLVYATLTNATLTEAKLCGAYMRGANLCGANLYKANLIKAHLFEATFLDAFITGAELNKADLSGADLRRSRVLEFAQLNCAVISSKTTLPQKFDPH